MPYDAFGVFTRSYNFTADKIAAIRIQSIRMDGEFDNYATAMNQVMMRSGVTTMSGNLKLGDNSVTGVAAGSAGAPSISPYINAASGIYFPDANTIVFVSNGTETGRIAITGFTTSSLSCSNFGVGVALGSIRGNSDFRGITSFQSIREDALIDATALTGAVNIDAVLTASTAASVTVFTANAVGNFTFNIRHNSLASLNSNMGIGQVLSLAIEVPCGGTAYYCTAITIDGSAPSQLKWFGGAPAGGYVSAINVYTITIIKTASATFLVRASLSSAT